MPTHKTYAVEEYVAFLKQEFSYNYGISEDTIATWFMTQHGAKPVINSYGVTKQNLLDTYIPRLKEAFDGGYVMFLAVTVTEGGGAGNWINHYQYDAGPTGLECMNQDIDYVFTTFGKQFPPAMNAPEVGGTYVEDVPGNTNEAYAQVSENSVGAYFMPSTMAGNAWVFGENWCLANQGPAAPAVYFGNPYNDIINMIKSTGADPFGDVGALPNPDPPNTGKEESVSSLDDAMMRLAQAIIDFFKDAIKPQVYRFTTIDEFYANTSLKVTKTYNNTYKLEYTGNLMELLQEILNIHDTGQDIGSGGQMDGGGGINENPPSIESGKDTTTLDALFNWCNDRQGQSFDYDGVYGAQCVDLITQLNHEFNLGLNLGGWYAKDIYHNALPAGWHKVAGSPSNDAESARIYDSLPNGCIVWLTNADAGHVGIKSGGWCMMLNQNVDNNGGIGGPIRNSQHKTWVESGGAGFLGAWTTD